MIEWLNTSEYHSFKVLDLGEGKRDSVNYIGQLSSVVLNLCNLVSSVISLSKEEMYKLQIAACIN